MISRKLSCFILLCFILLCLFIAINSNTITYDKTCLNEFGNCHGQGMCNTGSGVCSCDMGFSGQLCENPYMYCPNDTPSPCTCPNDYEQSHGLKNPSYLENTIQTCPIPKPTMGAGYKPSLVPTPAHIIILRHADRYYCDAVEKDEPSCKADYQPIRDNQNTNCLSNIGVKRSWRIGQWLNCYAKTNNIKISVLGTQCGNKNTNARPNTTATIIAQSLKAQKNPETFCSMTFNKQNKNSLSYALSDPIYTNTLAVITWDHGAIPHLLSVLGAKTNVKKSEGGCYDLAYDLNTSTGEVFIYKMGTLEPPDACSINCSDGKHIELCNAYNLEKQI